MEGRVSKIKHGGFLGSQLRYWRNQRSLSQLQLSSRIGVSTRHISFIETGKACPSRKLLLTLADALDIPMRARNGLLASAGFASAYKETGLNPEEMDEVKHMMVNFLHSTEPYPGLLINRYWDILMLNDSMRKIASIFSSDSQFLERPNANLMRLILHPEGMRKSIQNWTVFIPYMVNRVRRLLPIEGVDTGLTSLLTEISCYGCERGSNVDKNSGDIPEVMMPIHLKRGQAEVKLITTVAAIGDPRTLVLRELFLECGFPADDASDAFLRSIYDLEIPGGINEQPAEKLAI